MLNFTQGVLRLLCFEKSSQQTMNLSTGNFRWLFAITMHGFSDSRGCPLAGFSPVQARFFQFCHTDWHSSRKVESQARTVESGVDARVFLRWSGKEKVREFSFPDRANLI
jgi:hypothetical protein